MGKYTMLAVAIAMFQACNFINQDAPTSKVANLPAFKFQLLGSNVISNSSSIKSGQPVIFFYFKTDCPHCKKETQALLYNIKSFKEAQIYFLTYMPLDSIKIFYSNNRFNMFNNILIGRDYDYSFAKLYKPRTVPYVAIYDSNKKLKKIISGNDIINDILESMHN